MIVTWSNFKEVVAKLTETGVRSVDTETTGLRVHHGDRLFSIIIADESDSYYFNFQGYPDLDAELLLDRSLLALLKPVFSNPDSLWYAHKANFDSHILANEGLFIAGVIHCTKAIARVEYNDHMAYDLGSCAERIGEKKDDAVDAYITKHHLTSKVAIPGKAKRETLKHFDRVPYDIIVPYGCTDATVGRRLGQHQEKAIAAIAASTPPRLPQITNVLENERRLTKTIFRMERTGLLIDPVFCKRAIEFEGARGQALLREFKAVTGCEFSNSNTLFQKLFADQKENWSYTDKGGPSFDKEALENLTGPIADLLSGIRDYKAKSDFYHGFLYHADKNNRIHPTLNQDGGKHGRTSSSDPNMQNLKQNDEDEDGELVGEFHVRRAVIPTPGYFLCSIDMDQVEYRFMFDQAGEQSVIKKIRDEGLDVHQATANVANIVRQQGKRVNFGILFRQGDAALAKQLKVSIREARAIKATVLDGMPMLSRFIDGTTKAAKDRGYVFNWFGRRCNFPNSRFAYRAANHLVAGGCADIMKIGMNRLDQYFLDRPELKSRMIWNVHDENLFEIWYGEEHIIPELVEIMSNVYPYKYLPLTCGPEVSARSWADKQKTLEEVAV